MSEPVEDEFVIIKDPDAFLDYGVRWAARGWLSEGETITTSEWSEVEPAETGGVTKESPGNDGSTTVIWLRGGVEYHTYKITNHITTSAGRIDDRTLTVICRQK